MSDRFHTIVIGAGSGGLTVATGLVGLGKRTALVERGKIGGDCTNVGCVPSKLLIHLAAERRRHGLPPAEMLARVRDRRDALQREEREHFERMDGLELIRGAARLDGEGVVVVEAQEGGERRLETDRVVLATGSSPVVFPIDGLPEDRLLTNESLFDLEDLPEHLAVVGAGVIGSEMAFAFRALGSRVSLIDLAPRMLPPLEPEVAELMQRRAEEEGIELHLNARGSRYEPSGECGTLVLERGETSDGEGEIRVDGVDRVLLAVGRSPNTRGIGLETVGLEPGRGGLETNAWGATDAKGVYAIGDVNARSNFTHSANAQGRRLVQKLTFPWLPAGHEPTWPSATFTHPEIAQVGDTLEALRERFPAELIATRKIELSATDRGYTMGLDEGDGFVLIHALRLTGRVLSATIVAPNASEMIGPLVLAVNGGPSLYRLANQVHPYPVLSEAIKKAADAFVFDTLPNLPREALAWLRLRWRRP